MEVTSHTKRKVNILRLIQCDNQADTGLNLDIDEEISWSSRMKVSESVLLCVKSPFSVRVVVHLCWLFASSLQDYKTA